jgi:Ca2+ transporting ATPase
LLQIFNEVNARKLKSTELNVFKNFFNNPLFLVILVLTVAIQLLCVEFGGQSLKTVPLTQDEHLMCLGLGSLSIFAGFFFKLLIPASLFSFLSKENKPV